MCNSMTTENVCSLLILAWDSVSQELKKIAVKFISQNIEAMTGSEDWQDLVHEPHLMTSVVRSMGSKTKSDMWWKSDYIWKFENNWRKLYFLCCLKGIHDKNSAAHFWLTNFSLLFEADFQANPTDISCKE